MTGQSLRLFLLCVTTLLALVVSTASRATDFKPAACADSTPHKVRMVTVAPGVQLQVIDWGGSGQAMSAVRSPCLATRADRIGSTPSLVKNIRSNAW